MTLSPQSDPQTPSPTPCRRSRAATAVVRVGPLNGAGEGVPGAVAPVQNLHNTTIPAQMARLAVLTMKSMGNATGLGSGAGVVDLCSFPVTLSPQSRRFGRRRRPTTPAPDPQPPPPTSLSLLPVYRADHPPAALIGRRLNKRRRGRRRGAGVLPGGWPFYANGICVSRPGLASVPGTPSCGGGGGRWRRRAALVTLAV